MAQGTTFLLLVLLMVIVVVMANPNCLVPIYVKFFGEKTRKGGGAKLASEIGEIINSKAPPPNLDEHLTRRYQKKDFLEALKIMSRLRCTFVIVLVACVSMMTISVLSILISGTPLGSAIGPMVVALCIWLRIRFLSKYEKEAKKKRIEENQPGSTERDHGWDPRYGYRDLWGNKKPHD